jgi:TRAP-type C4-dicarboxylate transport system substrate-binding protein
VLTSLQTGLINTAFNSFYGSIVMQWFTRISYITDIPFVYAYGAFLLDKKTFSRLPPDYATMMRSVAQKHFSKLLIDTRQSNKEARQVLQDNDISLVELTPESRAELMNYREMTVDKLVGDAFSREIYKEAVKHLENFRRTQTANQ